MPLLRLKRGKEVVYGYLSFDLVRKKEEENRL